MIDHLWEAAGRHRRLDDAARRHQRGPALAAAVAAGKTRRLAIKGSAPFAT
jgi:hypothetical protein